MSTKINDYEPLRIKGQGVFGYVLEAYDKTKDIKVAIKKTPKIRVKASREYKILSMIKDCQYVIKLLDAFYTTNKEGKLSQNLVFEYIPRSLDKYVEKFLLNNEHIPIEKIKLFIKQILLGLDYCHKKKIVHRDLKPDNILLTKNEEIKICDFGSSKIIDEEKKTSSSPYIVSRYYRAPELILGKTDYNSKIDIFAAGCILAELFILTPLFQGKIEGFQIIEQMIILGNPGKAYFQSLNLPENYIDCLIKIDNRNIKKLEKILNEGGFYNEKDIEDGADLILKMLEWDIEKRFNAEQCLNHPFLSKKSN